MSLAACINRCPWTTRSPGSVKRLLGVVFEHRRSCLLDLEEQWVVLVAPLEQDNEGTSADAADTDHLACHVDDLEALQQLAPIFLQRGPISTELLVDHLFYLVGRV